MYSASSCATDCVFRWWPHQCIYSSSVLFLQNLTDLPPHPEKWSQGAVPGSLDPALPCSVEQHGQREAMWLLGQGHRTHAASPSSFSSFSPPLPCPLLSFSLSLSTCLQNPLTIFAGSPGLLKRPRVGVPAHSPTPLRVQQLQPVSVAWHVSGWDAFGTWPSRFPAQDPNIKKQRQCKERRMGNYWLIGVKFLSGIMKKFWKYWWWLYKHRERA